MMEGKKLLSFEELVEKASTRQNQKIYTINHPYHFVNGETNHMKHSFFR